MTTDNTHTTVTAPPATRVLWCNVCRRYTAHTWHGLQQFPGIGELPGKRYWLYNCRFCSDTTTVKV